MKILIVDDQPEVRETLKELLEINGHEVLAAEDGVAGVKLAEQSPDFIFCDVAMPRLDGPGVLAAIRQMPGVCDTPFVFLTGFAERDQQREGMTQGADDYITKPFSERDILDAIAARTRRQQGLREKIIALVEQHRREIHAHWSHELLTPLNAVMGGLDLLGDTDHISRAELKEMLSFIREGARRQERLARKLIRHFHLQRMLDSAPPPEPDCCPAALSITVGAAKAAREMNRTDTLAVATAAGDVASRAELLRDAIYEVVANAVTFSPPGSPVTVSGVVRDGSYRIDISDQGQGMTAEQRAQIGPFTQFGRQKREQQGLGLGLAIAEATAKLAGGNLTLEAGAGGRGLRVVFTLPLVGT
jgi:two-component system sensor histidine kinase/response regulator